MKQQPDSPIPCSLKNGFQRPDGQALENLPTAISNPWKVFAAAAIMALGMTARADDGMAPVAVAALPDGSRAYVAQAANERVVEYDPATTQALRRISLDAPPTTVLLNPSGSLLFIAEGGPEGRVLVAETGRMQVRQKFKAGHTPTGMALSPDGTKLAVCNRFNDNVAILDLKAGKEIAKVPVVREPVAVAWTPEGRIFAGNHLPAGPANGGYIASSISVIDAATSRLVTNIALPNGSTSLRGMCLSPDGRFVYVTHLLGHYQLPTTQLERGWMYVNTLSVIDTHAAALVNTVLLDDVDLGAANPWGVACSPDGSKLCVAHSGTHEISIIDRAALHDRLDRAAKGEKITEVTKSAADVPTDLSFVYTIRRRARLSGNGPRGIAVAAGKIFAAEYHSDTVGVTDLTNEYAKAVSLPLGRPEKMSLVRRGEMIFNDASHCFQHWQSCQSCHPDTRTDGLNWDLLNDGIGNPKNVKNMLYAHRTPPAMSLGVRDSAEVAVRAGFKYIQFAVMPEEDTAAVDEYLRSLRPTPSPHLEDGRLSDAAKRGRVIFDKTAGCAECHPAPLFTDLKRHDVGTSDEPMDAGEEFDTPSLVETWRTAPYVHDGRAGTLQELFQEFNPENKHGTTRNLTREQLNDLIEYVSSL